MSIYLSWEEATFGVKCGVAGKVKEVVVFSAARPIEISTL